MLSKRARAQNAFRFEKLFVLLIISMALSFAACACTSQRASLTSDRKQCGPGNLVESLSRPVDLFNRRRSNQAGRRKSLKDRHPSHSECDKSLEGRAASQSRRAKSCKKRQLTQPRRERSLKRSWIDPAWTVLPIDFTAHGQCIMHVAAFSSARACTIENQVKIDRKRPPDACQVAQRGTPSRSARWPSA